MFYIKNFLFILILCPNFCDKIISERYRPNKNIVKKIFGPIIKFPGPCQYFQSNRKQNRLCRLDAGLPEAIKEAKTLAVTFCEEQFRYDRWNCSIETRKKRNIFKKIYRETAFIHAIMAAAIVHSVSRACSEGKMMKCNCATESHPDQTRLAWRYGGCSDNIKHGKRMARKILELNSPDADEIDQLLSHNSEVGIQAVVDTMIDKCKCHGVTGSCSIKTCYKKVSDFSNTTALLRIKYHQAIRKIFSNKPSRRSITKKKKHKNSNIGILYYLETSPTFCSVTKGRRCLNPDNCATLCCGRSYITKVFIVKDQCHCRFHNGKCCRVICDYCDRKELRYFCR